MLILLADTRKKLLWLWLLGTGLIVLIVFAQTFAGQFEEIESTAWTWLFLVLLPTLALLFVAVLLNKNPSKVVLRSTFQKVYFGGLTYILFVLLTLVAMPFVSGNITFEAYLHQSYFWLLPFQGLLLAIIGILYFRKESFFRPNTAIMQEYVSKKAEFAKRSGSLSQTQSFNLLIQDDGLGKTLGFLDTQIENKPDELILFQSQYANWKRNRDLNLASKDDLQLELNRMTLAIIDFIETL